MTGRFNWLHLTDFHFGLSAQRYLWPTLRAAFLQDLGAMHDKSGPWDAVLFTGDLAQQGVAQEFKGMEKEVLSKIYEELTKLGSGNAKLYCVPGNHDLKRPAPKSANAAVDVLLDVGSFDRCREAFWANPKGDYRKVINKSLKCYTDWWNKCPWRNSNVKDGILPGDFSATHEVRGLKIGIAGLNTTFLQLGPGDYREKLEWDVRQLAGVCDDDVDAWAKAHDACILLTHQGADWLTAECQQHGDSELAPNGRFALHLYGHMHVPKLSLIPSLGESTHHMRLLGRSAFGLEFHGNSRVERIHGYSSGALFFNEDGTVDARIWPRLATNDTGPWRFVSDEANYHLEEDRATKPRTVAKFQSNNGRGKGASHSIQGSSGPNIPKSVDPLFSVYTPDCEEFYATRAVDVDVATYDKCKPLWLCGPSGCGKSSVALHFSAHNFKQLVFVDLSTSVGHDLVAICENLFWGLVDQLQSDIKLPVDKTPLKIFNAIERLFEEACRGDTVIIIDEFSCDQQNSSAEFVQMLGSLLVKFAATPKSRSLQIVIASVCSPLNGLRLSKEKFLERIHLVGMNKWSADELDQLIRLISKQMSWLADSAVAQTLRDAAQGCPRRLKELCRYHRRFLATPEWNMTKTISSYANEYPC